MIYEPPESTVADLAVMAAIEELRDELRFYLVHPRRWYGTLRRATFARAVQGSNSIEGYHASVEDVAALIEDEEPLDADLETRHAIVGYRDAMTYVLQLAGESPLDLSLVRSLHFMMLRYDLTKNPGQWRPGAIWIETEKGDVVYEAPEREQVDALMGETLDWINADDGPLLVRAAMAHLNVTLVHPFSDGNGRMARCLQTYVLGSAGPISSEFCSIEEYLGHDTAGYYAVLSKVAQGSWAPQRDAGPWVRYCLTAHYRQARTLLRRIRETEALWDRCEQLVSTHHLPERCVGALFDVARGWRLRRSLYVKLVRAATGEELSDTMATRDLRALSEAGLLAPVGERRARSYGPTTELQEVWQQLRAQRRPVVDEDPYALVDGA